MSLPAESRMDEYALFRTPLSMREAIAEAKARTFGPFRADKTTQAIFEAGWREAYRYMQTSLKEIA